MFSLATHSQESQMEYYPVGTSLEEVSTYFNARVRSDDSFVRIRYDVNRDTVVDGRRYKIALPAIVEKANVNPISSQYYIRYYIREQGDSIFIRNTFEYNDEKLVYAFNWSDDNGTFRWYTENFDRKKLTFSQLKLEDGNNYDCYSRGGYSDFNQLIWSIGQTGGGLFSRWNIGRDARTTYLTKFSRNGIQLYDNDIIPYGLFNRPRHIVYYWNDIGTLGYQLTRYSLADADSLKIYGKLDRASIHTLRRMLGGQQDSPDDLAGGTLHYLDLTDTYIINEESSDPYKPVVYTDTIWNSMLNGCSVMEDIKLPYGIKVIDDRAFADCQSLMRLTIPEKVKAVGSLVFQNCTSLESISLPYTVTSLGSGLVDGCTALKSVACEAKEPPSCSENTFGNMAGITLYVPIGYTDKYRKSAGWERFADIVEADPMNIRVEEAGTLESTINSMGLNNIDCLKITGEINGSDIRMLRRMLGGLYHTSFGEKRGKLYHLDLSDARIVCGGEDYFYNDIMRNKYLPPAYTGNDTIGNFMFFQCVNLQQLLLPSGIKAIGDNAFYYSSRLKELTVPEGVETIGNQAFLECGLKSLTLPSTITSLGDRIGGKGLQTVTIAALEPPTCSVATFHDTDTCAVLYVPAGCVEKYRNRVG